MISTACELVLEELPQGLLSSHVELGWGGDIELTASNFTSKVESDLAMAFIMWTKCGYYLNNVV